MPDPAAMASVQATTALPARLTMGDARATLALLAPALAAAEAPVIDASPLAVLDTAALAVLLECRRQAAARGRSLVITGAPPKLAQLATLYGMDGLLKL